MQSLRFLLWVLLMGAALRATPTLAKEKTTSSSVAFGELVGEGKLLKTGDEKKADKGAIGEVSIKHNLDALNAIRAKAGVPALKLDTKLNDFARKGSLELLKTHVPHGHFKSADVWANGFENAAAENQGDPHGWTPGPVDHAIDQILKAMMDEGPGGGHHDTIISPKYNRVGIGLIQDKNGRLYLTNDFSG